MKRIVLIVFCVALSAITLSAQKFDVSIETRYSDIKSYKKNKLVVEILTEDAKAITKLTKLKKDKPNALRDYRRFIKSYNKNIKIALNKYWKLTDTIMYLTPKEIKRLKESRARKIIVLSATEIGGADAFITRLEGTAIQLNFKKIGKSNSEADYKIMMPYSFSRVSRNNPSYDYLFTINMAVRNFNYMVSKKITSDVFDFMESEAMKNCKKQDKKVLLIDENLISRKADTKGIRKYYKRKKFKIIKNKKKEVLESSINNKNAENSYLVLIPHSVFSNPFGREKRTYVLCYKVIVDAADGTILNYTEGKVKATPDVALLQEKDFRYLNECEF